MSSQGVKARAPRRLVPNVGPKDHRSEPGLEERSRRLGVFRAGVVIRLANGQTWTFPDPLASWEMSDSAEYPALLEAVREASEEAERLQAELVLAIYLLSLNYNLSPGDYQAILDFGADRPALEAMQQAFRPVAEAHLRYALDHHRLG